VTDPLSIEFRREVLPRACVDVWSRKTSMWWPRSHSRSGDPGLEVMIEGRLGGRVYERTPAGEEHDWGKITAWEPPHRLAYLWHIYGAAADATHVEITFIPTKDATTVRITHSGWDRLGSKGPDLRKRNRASWDGLLPSFVAACEHIGSS
jgi:uncharacterized protein YndB with AHSA1/START domain